MGKKQSYLSLIIIGALLIFISELKAQNSYVLSGGIDVQAKYSKADSLLSISYTNNLPFSQLFWVKDFIVAAIINQNDVSGKYLASPILNEIYLTSKGTFTKNSISYYLRSDSSELDLYNYKLLQPKKTITVNVKISNSALIKMIANKELIVRGSYSLIDHSSINLYVSNDPKLKTNISALENYVLSNSLSKDLSPLLLFPDWKFNRIQKTTSPNGHSPMLAPQGEQILIHPKNIRSNKTFTPLTFKELYQFTTKMHYAVKID
ncbi:hypothetical protein EON78_02745 [bacterium]|nr:MAG: hypothetical protein EON78_02745 [bacterium]